MYKMNAEENKWMQGFMCAVATLIKLDGVQTFTMELFSAGAGNRSLKTLEKMGVDSYDLQILKQHWKQLKNIYP